MKYIEKLILMINLGFAAAILLSYLAPLIDPELIWSISFFGLFYPVFLIINVLFVLFWVFKKPQYALVSFICILIGWSQLKGFVGFNSQRIEHSDSAITLMTYNISNALYGYDKKADQRKIKKDNFIAFLEKYKDTDVLCIQEVGDYARDILKSTFPKHHMYFKNKGAVILSRFPIVDKGEIDFGTITNSCLWADIRIDKEIYRVYSFHLQSNQISKDAENFVISPELNQKQAWYDIKGMMRKYKNRHLQRSRQVEKIETHVQKCDHKVILAGDLNDPPQSYTYKIMSKYGKDAFRERGMGIGTTYAGRIPLLRIDYIFVDKSMQVATLDIIKDNFSDHYGLISTIEK
ncbi:MAG: endonuclease/exonuclease/phosphatase family protein [Chitinophagales bacterium]|nr:endonuclease/exonuclease/phosphatase family protein [Chitinophagales bacterium]